MDDKRKTDGGTAERRAPKPREEEHVDRRRALGILGGATICAAAATPLGGLLSCAGGGEGSGAPEPLRVPLSELPPGGRLRILHGEDPVELARDGDEVTARSLWCTHWGCEVRWVETDRVYRCPCHDGIFDENGRVMTGPPPESLRALQVRIEGSEVVVEPAASGEPVAG